MHVCVGTFDPWRGRIFSVVRQLDRITPFPQLPKVHLLRRIERLNLIDEKAQRHWNLAFHSLVSDSFTPSTNGQIPQSGCRKACFNFVCDDICKCCVFAHARGGPKESMRAHFPTWLALWRKELGGQIGACPIKSSNRSGRHSLGLMGLFIFFSK